MELGGALESPSLVELTLRRLRHEILSGALAPGERLVEQQARGLSCSSDSELSHTILRSSAILMLHVEGARVC